MDNEWYWWAKVAFRTLWYISILCHFKECSFLIYFGKRSEIQSYAKHSFNFKKLNLAQNPLNSSVKAVTFVPKLTDPWTWATVPWPFPGNCSQGAGDPATSPTNRSAIAGSHPQFCCRNSLKSKKSKNLKLKWAKPKNFLLFRITT